MGYGVLANFKATRRSRHKYFAFFAIRQNKEHDLLTSAKYK